MNLSSLLACARYSFNPPLLVISPVVASVVVRYACEIRTTCLTLLFERAVQLGAPCTHVKIMMSMLKSNVPVKHYFNLACCKGHQHIAAFIFEQVPGDFSDLCLIMSTGLHCAIHCNQLHICEWMFSTYIIYFDGYALFDAMMWCILAIRPNLEIFRLVLSLHQKIDKIANSYYRNAFMNACANNLLDFVKELRAFLEPSTVLSVCANRDSDEFYVLMRWEDDHTWFNLKSREIFNFLIK